MSSCYGTPINVSLSVAGLSDSLVWTGANLNGVVDAAPNYDLNVSVGSDYVYAKGYAACGNVVDSIWVVIDSMPALATISGPDTVCLGSMNAFSSDAIATIFSWDYDGFNSTLANPMFTSSNVGQDTLFFNYGNSCGAGLEVFKVITVESGAGFTSALVDTLTTCEGGSEVVNLQVNGITDTVIWTGANLSLVGDAAPNYTLDFSTGSGYVYATASSACGNAVDSMYVELKATPQFLNTLADSLIVCEGVPVSVVLGVNASTDSITWMGTHLLGVNSAGVNHDLSTMIGDEFAYVTAHGVCGNDRDSIFISTQNSPGLPTITGKDSVCFGETTAYAVGAGFDSYTWYRNGASGSNTLQSADLTFNSVGVDTLVIEVQNFCGTNSDTMFVDVEELPTISGLAESDTNCSGQALPVTVNVSSNADRFVWRGNLLDSAVAGTDYDFYMQPGADVVIAEATNRCGTESDTIFVESHEPITSLSILGAEQLCANATGAVYESSEQGSNYRYDWGVVGSVNGQVDYGDSIVLDYGTSTIALLLEVSNYCNTKDTSKVVAVESTISLPIYQLEDSLCWGESTVLSIPQVNGYSYSWHDADESVLGSTSQLEVIDDMTVYVKIQGPTGCEGYSDTATVNVNYFPKNYEPFDDDIFSCDPTYTLDLTTDPWYDSNYAKVFVGVDPSNDSIIEQLPDTLNSYTLDKTALYILSISDGECVNIDSVGIGIRESFILLNDTVVNTHESEEIIVVFNDYIWVNNDEYQVAELYDEFGADTNAVVTVQNGEEIRYVPKKDFSGLDTVRYEVWSNECVVYRDTAFVFIHVLPAALNDSVVTNDYSDVTDSLYVILDSALVLGNDRGNIISITWDDFSVFGAVVLSDVLSLSETERGVSYHDTLRTKYAGQTIVDTVYYEVCDDSVCLKAAAFFEVQFDEITISSIDTAFTYRAYNLVTPNSDGINDFLRLEFFTVEVDTISGDSVETRVIPLTSKIRIFSKWGDMVYSSDDYRNDPDLAFFGINNVKTEEEVLPSGTYYYVLEYEIEEQKRPETVSGFLVLKRDE
jgi:hypothetical protein